MWKRGEETSILFSHEAKLIEKNLNFDQVVLYRGTVYFTLSEAFAFLNYSFPYIYAFATFIFCASLEPTGAGQGEMSPSACRNAGECFQNKEIKKL